MLNGLVILHFLISEFGGMYFDNDLIVLKSFDDLRLFPLALGRENEEKVSNGIIVSTSKKYVFKPQIRCTSCDT